MVFFQQISTSTLNQWCSKPPPTVCNVLFGRHAILNNRFDSILRRPHSFKFVCYLFTHRAAVQPDPNSTPGVHRAFQFQSSPELLPLQLNFTQFRSRSKCICALWSVRTILDRFPRWPGRRRACLHDTSRARGAVNWRKVTPFFLLLYFSSKKVFFLEFHKKIKL